MLKIRKEIKKWEEEQAARTEAFNKLANEVKAEMDKCEVEFEQLSTDIHNRIITAQNSMNSSPIMNFLRF